MSRSTLRFLWQQRDKSKSLVPYIIKNLMKMINRQPRKRQYTEISTFHHWRTLDSWMSKGFKILFSSKPNKVSEYSYIIMHRLQFYHVLTIDDWFSMAHQLMGCAQIINLLLNNQRNLDHQLSFSKVYINWKPSMEWLNRKSLLTMQCGANMARRNGSYHTRCFQPMSVILLWISSRCVPSQINQQMQQPSIQICITST